MVFGRVCELVHRRTHAQRLTAREACWYHDSDDLFEVEMSFPGLITSPFSQSQQSLPPLWKICRHFPTQPCGQHAGWIHCQSSETVPSYFILMKMSEMKEEQLPQVAVVLTDAAFKAMRPVVHRFNWKGFLKRIPPNFWICTLWACFIFYKPAPFV